MATFFGGATAKVNNAARDWAVHFSNLRNLGLPVPPVTWQRISNAEFSQRYQHPVLEKKTLGKGAFGTVYQMKSRDGYDFAVKIIKSDEKQEYLDDEVRLLQAVKPNASTCISGIICYIEHGKITDYYDEETNTVSERAYIVTSFIPGKDLTRFIRQNMNTIPAANLRDLLKSALESLVYLHSRGIAHRDIKPDNLFVDALGHVIFLDLGLSCFAQQSPNTAPKCDALAGTQCYMSPEMLAAHTQNDASKDDEMVFANDVYGLAMSFYAFASKIPPLLSEERKKGAKELCNVSSATQFTMYLPPKSQASSAAAKIDAAMVSNALFHMLAPQERRPLAKNVLAYLNQNDPNSSLMFPAVAADRPRLPTSKAQKKLQKNVPTSPTPQWF